jgi:hypothetical protein
MFGLKFPRVDAAQSFYFFKPGDKAVPSRNALGRQSYQSLKSIFAARSLDFYVVCFVHTMIEGYKNLMLDAIGR